MEVVRELFVVESTGRIPFRRPKDTLRWNAGITSLDSIYTGPRPLRRYQSNHPALNHYSHNTLLTSSYPQIHLGLWILLCRDRGLLKRRKSTQKDMGLEAKWPLFL